MGDPVPLCPFCAAGVALASCHPWCPPVFLVDTMLAFCGTNFKMPRQDAYRSLAGGLVERAESAVFALLLSHFERTVPITCRSVSTRSLPSRALTSL